VPRGMALPMEVVRFVVIWRTATTSSSDVTFLDLCGHELGNFSNVAGTRQGLGILSTLPKVSRQGLCHRRLKEVAWHVLGTKWCTTVAVEMAASSLI
jgi:hypothetical protein